jgi:hypothetical protein
LTVPEVVDVYNHAIALLLRELDAMDEGDPIREQLAEFSAKDPYVALFAGAGPSDDGTLDAARIAANLGALDAEATARGRLSTLLHDYASYALFLARPHLRRNAAASTTAKPRVSQRVTEMLHTIAPSTIPPAKTPAEDG